jgi:hypothetical protein
LAAVDQIRREAGWGDVSHAHDVAKNAVLLLEFGAAAREFGFDLLRYLRQLPTEMQIDSAFPALRALARAVSSRSGSRKKVENALNGPDNYRALHLFCQMAALVAKAVLANPARKLKQGSGYVPTRFQKRLLKELNGKALTADNLQARLNKDRKQLYRDGINPLRDEGLIENDRRLGGYYRPDSPPKP